jgi:hypothetical protein
MYDNDIITGLIAFARDHGIDADFSVEPGLIRTGVDGFYRFHDDWPAAVDDLTKRVAVAVGARR